MTPKQRLSNNLVEQIGRLDGELEVLGNRSDRFSQVRLATFVLGALFSGTTLLTYGIWAWLSVTLLALIPFAVSVFAHGRVERQMAHLEITVATKRIQLARMTHDWSGIPAASPVAFASDHPFAADLDLVGDRSVHHLLDTAASREGSQRLCDWLLECRPERDCLIQRQSLVKELTDLHDFRDGLSFNAQLILDGKEERWPGNRLLDWIEEHSKDLRLERALLLLIPLSIVNVTLAGLHATGVLPPWWVISWVVYLGISFAQVRRIGDMFQESFTLRDGLEGLGHIFGFLESFPYDEKQMLSQLCRPFLAPGERPSSQLSRVRRVVAATALQRNFALWFWINAIVPWDIYFARRLDQAKRELRELLPIWLDVWYELEALNSLANFAFLNPEATFPILLPADAVNESSPFNAQALGHPLIPDDSRVCNDFLVDSLGSIFMITGSNMAGKSTFLRTLGVNLALAYAGAPVIAERMSVAHMRLFTAVKVTDSVVNGFSYFYAEVRRLKELLDALEADDAPPLFYLIDEIFRGTNNRERLVGSRSYVRALAGGRGVGVIATHDLELVKLAGEAPDIVNFHFRDDVEHGRMVFDYKLHPGPCPTTNALEIMRLAGLPVVDQR